jgi:hypothetical protein
MARNVNIASRWHFSCQLGENADDWGLQKQKRSEGKTNVYTCPKIRDEILEDAAALGGKGFSAHFG